MINLYQSHASNMWAGLILRPLPATTLKLSSFDYGAIQWSNIDTDFLSIKHKTNYFRWRSNPCFTTRKIKLSYSLRFNINT